MTAQSKDDVPFDLASYRVIFYGHTLTGCKELRAKLDLAIKELLAALNRTNNPFQEVAATRGGFRVRGKTPLFKAVSIRDMTPGLRALIAERKLVYLEDLRTIDLEGLRQRPGFGETSLGQLCSILSEFELYDNVELFHKFIVDNRVDSENNSVGRSFRFRREYGASR